MDDGFFERPVTPEQSGLRADAVAAELFPDYSRSRITAWFKQGRVWIDGETVKPKTKVFAEQVVKLLPTEDAEVTWQPEAMELDIVDADADVIIVNKPIDLVVHPGAGNPSGTLVNGLLGAFPELERLPRAGLVHRIDKDTTGLLAIARSERAHKSLTAQLQDRTMGRVYWCVALGTILTPGEIEAPIARHPTQRIKMAVRDGGREALTYYDVEGRYPGATLLNVTLATGRTHQIRVHMAHLGHPLLGDPLYGGNRLLPSTVPEPLREAQQALGRQALHAMQLSLRHPGSQDWAQWEAPLPEDLQRLEDLLEAL